MYPRSRQNRCRALALALSGALAGYLVLGPAAMPAPAAGVGPDGLSGVYVVQLADEPVVTHRDLRRTAGRRPDPDSDAVRAYVARLDLRRDALLAAVSGRGRAVAPRPEVLHTYDHALSGFAARLTSGQAARLTAAPGVRSVTRNETLYLTGSRTEAAASALPLADTARFLGLSSRQGLWSRFDGGPGRAGEGMIIGVVDTGIDPANPMLRPSPAPRPDAEAIARKWRGGCDAGTGPGQRFTCTGKVIGAAYFGKSVPGATPASPLDTEGHGTHTATIAAGNHRVAVSLPPSVLEGELSGVAPAARVAAYKACWGAAGCPLADVVAAMDRAVADGVDVINLSVGGALPSMDNPLYAAQLNAAAAGVFVATAAGNNGPGTVANTAPWVTTVAAAHGDTGYRTALALGDGTVFTGAGADRAVASAPLVDAARAGAPDTDPARLSRCSPGTLDAAKARGAVVICERGWIDRAAKSDEVRRAGGIGMVLVNTDDDQDLLTEVVSVPTVHLSAVDGAAVRAYAATSDAAVRLGTSRSVPRPTPGIAGFSSGGPDTLAHGDVLKPDLAAPGVDIAAGVAPVGTTPRFGVLSGTSMAAPHVAGLALLLKGLHPGWSPMAVKSALMTTASTTDGTGRPVRRSGAKATPFDLGSGHVTPAAAADPGLVYDSAFADWTDFLCAVSRPDVPGNNPRCGAARRIDAVDLNGPSIAVGHLTGRRTVTRTVTNVGSVRAVYRATVKPPAGFEARVTPEVLDLAPRASARFTVRLTRRDAVYGRWAFGTLTWTDEHRQHQVRSPVALLAHRLDAPGTAAG
ncbi:S8 family serine peptidase [Streptomyces sp. S.PB5]|uniref:S8 family serine peptidase n=1 Tax=Streptomyces sp. S.PB5 TaxID=3020844 RepID=UPI0025B0E20A|nr:S8 family serine peptidase [Streptomyces sp. S.PB5]MDN3022799.1 S8 family serine peptidase [Streptomyces sp. S.PB5]